MKIKNTHKLVIISTLAVLFFGLFFSLPLKAEETQNDTSIPILNDVRKEYNQSAKNMGYEISTSPNGTFTKLMNFRNTILLTISSFLGVIFLVMMLWGGYEWMFAGGNEERVTTAKKRIKDSVIGLIIVLSAYIIVSFILIMFFEI